MWNPQTHEYISYENGAWAGYDGDNNRISITNRSILKRLSAKFSADIGFPVNLGGLEGYFSESTEQTGAQITESVIDRAQEGGIGRREGRVFPILMIRRPRWKKVHITSRSGH